MGMKFENENLFDELVRGSGMNLFLGAGFSTLAKNGQGEVLPLGGEVNIKLSNVFGLDPKEHRSLSKTCKRIKVAHSDELENYLKEIYTVDNYDEKYLILTRLPIKTIITTNIDNLIELVYGNPRSLSNIADTKIYGSLEKDNVVPLFKLHGSVTYPFGSDMSFTEAELRDLFLRDNALFQVVSHKLTIAPNLFWGTSLSDENSWQMLLNSIRIAKGASHNWIVVYPSEENKKIIEDLRLDGFSVIESNTAEMLDYLSNKTYAKEENERKNGYKEYQKKFPNSFVCNELKKRCVKRPVVDFFQGAEPIISDIVSNNVTKTSYFATLLNVILKDKLTLITGIPGCGKTTLLMQLAFSSELTGRKFFFSNIIKEEAENLVTLVKEDNNVTVFIDNLYNNVEAVKILKNSANIRLVVCERPLNYEHVKRFLNVSPDRIVDVSELKDEDVQQICKSMNRPAQLAKELKDKNANVSLLEIVFYTATSSHLKEKIAEYIKDLKAYSDKNLHINLLELFTLVNYTSYCGVPCSMDMMYFYFSGSISNYSDIVYALNKMNHIIVESNSCDNNDNNQDYMEIRSKLFAEESFKIINQKEIANVLKNFLERVGQHVIYRYDVFKFKAYDADLTNKAFSKEDGIDFYEKILTNNASPYVRQQYALFLHRKNDLDKAWEQIDQAYTDSRKKIFTIANTHAIIMFDMNIEKQAKDNELRILKKTIEESFDTLEFCITQDVRVFYHIQCYAKNAVRYYRRFLDDEYTPIYIKNALNQVEEVLNSSEYIYRGTRRQLIDQKKELLEIQKMIN